MADMLGKYKTSDMTIEYFPPWLHDFIKRNIDFDLLSQKLTSQNADVLVDKAMAVIHGGLNVVLGIIGWLIVFLYVIFIMLDYDRLIARFPGLWCRRGSRKIAYKLGGDIKGFDETIISVARR